MPSRNDSSVTASDSTSETVLSDARPFQFRLRTLFIVIAAVAVLLSMWKVFGLWMDEWKGPISERGFAKIEIGMTLDEVEAILGPGKQISVADVTAVPGAPDAERKGDLYLRLDGDQFFRWKETETGTEILVGVRNGKVCDRDYWASSL
jgi:hypothetical protein